MNKRIGIAASILAGMLLVVLACKKIEQPEMAQLNKECDCAKEVSADFVMEEMSAIQGQSWNRFTITDTIFKGKNVRFNAVEDGATYTWYLGQEILTSKSIGRFFSENLAGTNIPITLVVKKKPNSICFPNDDGYDSITKIMHVSHFVNETPDDFEVGSIEGNYRVKSSYLEDSFDIVVSVIKHPLGNMCLNIENYNGLGSNALTCNLKAINYRQLYFWGDINEGYIHSQMNGVFEANFFRHDTSIDYHYFGRKL